MGEHIPEMNNQIITGRSIQQTDTVIFYDGRSSRLYLIPSLLIAILPATLASIASLYIHWPVVLTHPHLLIEGVLKYGLYLQPLLLVGIISLSILSISLFIRGFAVWYSEAYLLTNDRVEYERGIFSKTIVNVELWRVQDVRFHRSILQALLGLGVIDIIAMDETVSHLEIGPIRNARAIYDKLKQERLRSGRLAGAQAMGMSKS